MNDWMDNNLRHISSIETRNASYEFSVVGVWRNINDGSFVYADDSGCSCPIPFENHSESSFSPLNEHTWNDLVRTVMNRDRGEYGITAVERVAWLTRLSNTLAEERQRPSVDVPNPFTENG